jgi:cytochrome c551/c552
LAKLVKDVHPTSVGVWGHVPFPTVGVVPKDLKLKRDLAFFATDKDFYVCRRV